MNEAIGLLPSLAIGMLLGAFFFGGLWWTVHRALAPESPAPALLPSLLVRSLVVVAVLPMTAHQGWGRQLALLVGFMGGRALVLHLSQKRRVMRWREKVAR